MERIGDYASDIAEILTMPCTEPLVPMPPMRKHERGSLQMVRRAIDAFVKRDVSGTRGDPPDDIVDDLFMQVRNELIVMIATTPNPARTGDALMFAKYFERIVTMPPVAEWWNMP